MLFDSNINETKFELLHLVFLCYTHLQMETMHMDSDLRDLLSTLPYGLYKDKTSL